MVVSGGGRERKYNNTAAGGADTIHISEEAQIHVVKHSSFSLSQRQRQIAQNYRRLNKVGCSKRVFFYCNL